VENFNKWGFKEPVPIEEILQRLELLEEKVRILEDENVSTTNELYRLENSLDARIDILSENKLNHFNLGDK